MKLRAWLFDKGVLPSHTIRVPVISAGNLTMGGSGKTPVVIYLARYMLRQGLKPAVVSRGYGGKASKRVNIVSDGTKILLDSRQAGDEPRLIAESVPNAYVLTGKKRVFPCRHAAEIFHCDVIILDDGFQHLNVRRDMDLVLFNAATLQNTMHVFPGGFLRESFSALKRADCFLITGYTEELSEEISVFHQFINTRWQNTPFFCLEYMPQYFIDRNGDTSPLSAINSSALAFCGIASPERFHNSLKRISITPVGFLSFQDHKMYDEKSIQKIKNLAVQHGAEILLTTEKDLVKLKHADFGLPLYALSMQVERHPDFDAYLNKFLPVLKNR
jgi:tetraacyldisaccharide 4'-kinase